MARTPKPWFREDRQAFFVTIGGVRHNLGPDRKEAFRQFHELMGKVDQFGGPVAPIHEIAAPDSMTVGQVFEKYLDWCQKHRSLRTYDWTRKHIQNFCNFLKIARTYPANSLKPFHIVEWVDSQPQWGANHKRGAIIAVCRPFNWASKLGYIHFNPVRGVEKPTATKRESSLTADDFSRLVALVKDQPFRDLLMFAYEAGVRPQEARHIESRHVCIEKGRIEIPPDEAKGKRRWRVIYLSPEAAMIIRRLMQDHPNGKLFVNLDGNPWKAQAIVCRFQRLLVKLTGQDTSVPTLSRFDRRQYNDPEQLATARANHKRKLTELRKKRSKLARQEKQRIAMYDLRHLFASRKLKEGHDPITVAALLGHKDGAMLCRHYENISTDGEHLRKAVSGD